MTMKIPINQLKTCSINAEIYRDSDVGDLVNSIGEVGLLQPLVAVPEFFVLQSYPSAEGLALEIGITHRYIMSGMLFIVVCFAFQSRNVEKVDNQKAILLGAAIGFSAMCAVIISMPVFRGIPLSIPPMIATGTIAALSFWSRSKLS